MAVILEVLSIESGESTLGEQRHDLHETKEGHQRGASLEPIRHRHVVLVDANSMVP